MSTARLSVVRVDVESDIVPRPHPLSESRAAILSARTVDVGVIVQQEQRGLSDDAQTPGSTSAGVLTVVGEAVRATSAPNFAEEEVISLMTDYQRQLAAVRQHGHAMNACSVLCIFSGCFNFFANCCFAFILSIFAQKASTFPDEPDRRQCCLCFGKGTAVQVIERGLRAMLVVLTLWLLVILLTLRTAKEVLENPDIVGGGGSPRAPGDDGSWGAEEGPHEHPATTGRGEQTLEVSCREKIL